MELAPAVLQGSSGAEPRSYQLTDSRTVLERPAIEGDSPVYEIQSTPDEFLSTMGHVKSRGNPGGPPSKAKYSLATDSELVPRGKGEKNPGGGGKRT